jgi:hypothetical protein
MSEHESSPLPGTRATQGNDLELSQQSGYCLIIGPKRWVRITVAILPLLAGLTFLAVVSSVHSHNLDLGAASGVIFGIIASLGPLLVLYQLVPWFKFDVVRGQFTWGKLGRRKSLPLAHVVGVQVCFGGVYFRREEDGQTTPYETWQVNLITGAVDRRRINVSHHSDRNWTRATGSRLAEFLHVPLLDQLG